MYMNYKLCNDHEQNNQKQEQLIRAISHRFMTYGYTRIETPAFEKYDLYSKVNSSINLREMIKVIDQTGEVLVLRPDMTIPITRQLAQEYSELPYELRYFYVEDVFRLSKGVHDCLERTQAGIEYFCNRSREADAEVIALAIHILKDLRFKEIKIEMGDAGFFRELVQEMHLDPTQFSQLKHLVQTKNAVDLDRFLQGISMDENIKNIVGKVPFLYGNPESVRGKINDLTLTEEMGRKINYLLEIVEVLSMYGLEKHIVIDLGLINHMDYYSDVIFQGFVENVGEPVVMGGRYNQLGNAFNATLPAIGFACYVDSLVTASQKEFEAVPIDFFIKYETNQLAEAINIASELRKRDYRVLTMVDEEGNLDYQNGVFQISLRENRKELHHNDRQERFKDIPELLDLIVTGGGNVSG